MQIQGVVDGLQSEEELPLALQYLEVGGGSQEVGLQDEDQVEVGEVGGDLTAEAPEELVAQPLIVESALHEKSAESTVVIVLMFKGLHQLEHEHLYGLVLDLGGTETLDGVLVNPLVRVLVVQQLEGILQLNDGPGPQESVEIFNLAVVLVVNTVNDPGYDGLVQSLAVLLQPHQQVLLLHCDWVERVSPGYPL